MGVALLPQRSPWQPENPGETAHLVLFFFRFPPPCFEVWGGGGGGGKLAEKMSGIRIGFRTPGYEW